MTYHILYEDQYERLYDMELYDVGDSIVYIPNNQLGYMKYKVIMIWLMQEMQLHL